MKYIVGVTAYFFQPGEAFTTEDYVHFNHALGFWSLFHSESETELRHCIELDDEAIGTESIPLPDFVVTKPFQRFDLRHYTIVQHPDYQDYFNPLQEYIVNCHYHDEEHLIEKQLYEMALTCPRLFIHINYPRRKMTAFLTEWECNLGDPDFDENKDEVTATIRKLEIPL